MRNPNSALISDFDGSSLPDSIMQLPRPLVFTNGCYDIIHIGHVTLLEEAASLGESLVVGLNNDDSVRRQGKGTDRPFNTQDHRARVMAALRWVSAVVIFDDDTPLSLIQCLRPDVLVKGGDWPLETIVGGREVQENGGQVVSVPFQFQTSTTDLVARIRR